MVLPHKLIIYLAVSKYLSDSNLRDLNDHLSEYKILSANKFIEILSQYFDFKLLRDNPIISEDVWLYNYLMYENNSDRKIFEIGEKIMIKGRFKTTKLLIKYEKILLASDYKKYYPKSLNCLF